MMRILGVGTVITLAMTVVPQLSQTETLSAAERSRTTLLPRPTRPIVGPHAQDTTVSFARDITPILERSCYQCHGGEDEDGLQTVELELNMTTYEGLMAGSVDGTVVEPGKPDESYIIDMVVNGDMPEEGDPLTPEEIDIIRRWIAAGALNN